MEGASININIALLGYGAADGTGFGMKNPRVWKICWSVDVVLTLLEGKEMKGIPDIR